MELNGEYIVVFKHPDDDTSTPNYRKFVGKCDNFVPSGVCAFSNDNNEMLIVRYRDIAQMRLISNNSK